jgi:hypothetical protein
MKALEQISTSISKNVEILNLWLTNLENRKNKRAHYTSYDVRISPNCSQEEEVGKTVTSNKSTSSIKNGIIGNEIIENGTVKMGTREYQKPQNRKQLSSVEYCTKLDPKVFPFF